MNRNMKWASWAAGAVLVAFLPQLCGIYYANTMIVPFAVWALFAVSLNLLLGFMGLLSFGHAMYFGTGAYGTALALAHFRGMTMIPGVIIGMVFSVFLASIIAPLVVRVSGTAFAMLHLAFAQLLYVLALKLRNITGGEDGISVYPRPDLGFFGLYTTETTDLVFYYFAIAVIVGALIFLWFFIKTPFGQIIVGLRDNSKRIDYLGFRVSHTKAVTYIVSGAFAGLAGAIYVLLQNGISANDAYGMPISVFPIMMVMVGGAMSFFGPIYGAAGFAILDEWVASGRFQQMIDSIMGAILPDGMAHFVAALFQFELILGLILVLVTMYWPLGLSGFITAQRVRWQMRKQTAAFKRSAN